jgi:methylated-DNA-[protein]-cysteine S-methyltransferase
MDFDAIISAPFGALGIRCHADALSEIRFLPPGTSTSAPRNALAECAAAQLTQWLGDPHIAFDLPLATAGTPFQQRVWAAIARIPVGQLRRYGELSAELGSAARAVGQACGANPFPIIVPCHRVVARHAMGGFAHANSGFLIETKQWLQRHECLR